MCSQHSSQMLFRKCRRFNFASWMLCSFTIMTLLPDLVISFDPCPDAEGESSEAELSFLTEEEVEEAFLQSEEIIRRRTQLETNLVKQGRYIRPDEVTAESHHQPIQLAALSVIREREIQQLLFEEASKVLTVKHGLSAAQVSCGLPKLSLKGPVAKRALKSCNADEPEIKCDSKSKYRTVDGTCNNLKHPAWGSTLSCVRRFLLPAYEGYSDFRRSVNNQDLPDPRKLSLEVHTNVNRSHAYLSSLYIFFGQALDHDMTTTVGSITVGNKVIQCCPDIDNNHPRCAPIALKSDDPFYSQFGKTCMNFVRGASCHYCKLGPKVQSDAVSPFIDASFIYGNSYEAMNVTRTSDGTGDVKMQCTKVGLLLPPSQDPNSDRCSRPAENKICFQSGDPRANQHPGLIGLHTLFAREHRRVSREIRSLNPQWSGDTVFQETRKIVGAEMQMISYGEYLPITLGNQLTTYFNNSIGQAETIYDPSINPTMRTEFTTAVFRFGHSLIPSVISEDSLHIGRTNFLFRDKFVNPFGFYEGEMDTLFRGITRTRASVEDRHLVTDVTNFLYRIPGTQAGLDLAAINIQRGRCAGLQPYISYVKFCTAIIIRNFDDLRKYNLMTERTVDALRRVYKYVEDIDLFTGVISELPLAGAVVGPTAACIIGREFQILKFGDRFYFQHEGQPNSFTKAQIRELKKTSLAKVICDNTKITEMQKQAMLVPADGNPVLPCSKIPGINLKKWKQLIKN